jgi:hypothetical protein
MGSNAENGHAILNREATVLMGNKKRPCFMAHDN